MTITKEELEKALNDPEMQKHAQKVLAEKVKSKLGKASTGGIIGTSGLPSLEEDVTNPVHK
ncbi:MAG: hypothetical protein ACP5SH_08845 [Syntrophobacteraceae bacterium]